MFKPKYLSLRFELSGAANIQEGFEPRTPTLQFELPLEDAAASHDDQVRAPGACGGKRYSMLLCGYNCCWGPGTDSEQLQRCVWGCTGVLATMQPGVGSRPQESRPDSQQAIGEDDWTHRYQMSTYSKISNPPVSLSRCKGQRSEASSRVARSPRLPQPPWARSLRGPTSSQNTPIPAQQMWFPSRSEKQGF